MSNKIRVLVDRSIQTKSTSRAARPSIEELLGSAAGKTLEIEVHELGEQLSSVYAKVLSALGSIPSADPFNLDSVTFTLAIDSTGGVSLVSTLSGSVRTQAGLTFVLSKRGVVVSNATFDKT